MCSELGTILILELMCNLILVFPPGYDYPGGGHLIIKRKKRQDFHSFLFLPVYLS